MYLRKLKIKNTHFFLKFFFGFFFAIEVLEGFI
jgi:hypothetical protein